ncbi:MAG: sodium/proline symporter PutP [Phycisphaerae bacterium]|nr:sodium/proline symporter PutP [Phycisphaerae bacterium]NIP54290.1 sodium/proline symporter PutP [Phycisphaerae bacterium]NIS53159.1 sodium/proline symporter PutP [Phycisphaerae bacterium]NIU10644.1 sodium/proline symporter PutP [Phycisphaerae bacterium]NIU58405.1 sodium/proline symporter PutP [Phycisphaerae bacterium]
MSTPTLVTFIIYFVLLLGIGFYFYRKSASIEDYLLGGRRMGAWVTALSAQASDMSGWLLMALPGAIYAYGMGKVWIAIGLFAGTVLNWKLVSGRLRVYTQKTDTITLPCFFEQRFGDPTGLLRVVSAIIILLFFTIYASAHLQATGYLLESTFGVQYGTAVIIGGSIIIAYTFLGGFLAVCWTDLFQGSLMVLALMVVPVVAYLKVGGAETISQAMKLKEMSTSLLPAKGAAGLLAIVSMMAWGLGYFGQPHILTRFMSVKSVRKLPESMTIAIVWVFLSLTGAVIIGFVGIGMFENLAVDQDEHEKVFIYMIGQVMHPWLAGIMLAAILSAIMSTIDSQLLVSSSALTEDFYQKAIKKNATEKEIILVGRICVIIISVIALILALRPSDTILGIVAYSWGGFGAAFGPLVLFGLFSKKTGWQSALAGMVVGTVVLIVWKQIGLGDYMYEIVPGFSANCLAILLVNIAVGQKDEKILEQYQEVVRTILGKG